MRLKVGKTSGLKVSGKEIGPHPHGLIKPGVKAKATGPQWVTRATSAKEPCQSVRSNDGTGTMRLATMDGPLVEMLAQMCQARQRKPR